MDEYDYKNDVFFSYELKSDNKESAIIEWDENVSETDKWELAKIFP